MKDWCITGVAGVTIPDSSMVEADPLPTLQHMASGALAGVMAFRPIGGVTFLAVGETGVIEGISCPGRG